MKVQATAKVKDKDGKITGERTGEIEYDFGDNLKAAAKNFGEDVVFNMFRQAAVISLQGRMRSFLANPENDEKKLAEHLKDWKPGVVTRTKKSPSEKLKELFSGMSPEEISAAIKEAQAEAA